MTSTIIKIGSGVASAALIVAGFANGVFAQDSVIDTNGANSNNTISNTSTNTTTLDQTNNNTPSVTLTVNSDTGHNDANDNTGGTVAIGTGDSNTTMNVTVGGSVNDATLNCGCDTSASTVGLVITHNGSGSTNHITNDPTTRLNATQSNTNHPVLNGTVNTNTGGNHTNRNTFGTSGLTTLQVGDQAGVIQTGMSNTTINATVRGARNRFNRTATITPTPTSTDLGL